IEERRHAVFQGVAAYSRSVCQGSAGIRGEEAIAPTRYRGEVTGPWRCATMPEMFCPTCGKETLVLKEAVYEGFTRTGDRMKCAVCGHTFEAPVEELSKKKAPSIFTEADRSPTLAIFGEGENKVIC